MVSHTEAQGGARDMTPLASARGVIPGAEQRWMQ